jgi:hypothetical protein
VLLTVAYLLHLALLGALRELFDDAMGRADRRLFKYAVVTLAVLLVAVVYRLLVGWWRFTVRFQPWTLRPFAEAGMSVAMEFVAVAVLTVGGLRTPAWRPSLADVGGGGPAFPGGGATVFQASPALPPDAGDVVELEPVSPTTTTTMTTTTTTAPQQGVGQLRIDGDAAMDL